MSPVGEKIRRAVRALEHPQLPFLPDARHERARNGLRFRRAPSARDGAEVQHIAREQCPPAVAAELAQREGGAASQVAGNVEAAADREIGAAAARRAARRPAGSRPHATDSGDQ